MDSLNIGTGNPYTGLMSKFSSSFQQFVKDIGDAKSKSEEDRIITREITYLKKTLKKPGVTSKEIKEGIVRMIHFEMLGHDVSFAYMEVVKFAQQQNLLEKRIAYAALSIFLDEKNDIECMMNMSSIQKDLKSSNLYEISFGLIAASQLVFKDMIPAVIDSVAALMKHKNGFIRKKAVMTMFRFYQVDAGLMKPYLKLFDNALLCDKDPAVLSVSLNTFIYLITENPTAYKRLTGSFVNILKQILNRKLPEDFDHRGVRSPWLQIKILNMLAMLGSDDMKQSKEMYEILRECLDSTNTDDTIGCAVIYECMKTIATIYPNRALVQLAAGKARLFLVAKNNNLKYLGITVLSSLVDIDIAYALESQMDIIECLNDHDDSIKRKTLDLLYRMTTTDNVKVICNEFIQYLRSTVDDYVKSDLVIKITTIAEKYSPDNEWFIDTMNDVFELGGNLVQPEVAYNMMRIIGEDEASLCLQSMHKDASAVMKIDRCIGDGDDDEDDDEATDDLRKNAVITYTMLLEKPYLPDILIQVICWVVGEYIELIEDYQYEDLIEKFYELLTRRFSDTVTQSWVVNAIGKVMSKIPNPSKHFKTIDSSLLTCDAKQRYVELQTIFKSNIDIEQLFPYDASCEDIDVDLSFLDSFVNNALQCGALPYSNELKEESCILQNNESYQGPMFGIRIHEYETPTKPFHSTSTANDRSLIASPVSTISNSSDERSNLPRKPKSVIWTKEGIVKKNQSPSPINTDSSNSDVASQPSNESSSFNAGSSDKQASSHEDKSSDTKSDNHHHSYEGKPDPKKMLAEKLFSAQSQSTSSLKHGRKDTTSKLKRTPKSHRQTQNQGPLIEMHDTQPTILKNTNDVTTDDVMNPVDFFFGDLNINESTQHGIGDGMPGSHCTDLMIDENAQGTLPTKDVLNLSVAVDQTCLLDTDIVVKTTTSIDDTERTDKQSGFASTLEQLNNTRVLVTIPEELSSFKHSNQIEICTDMNLRVMCQYVYKPTELAIILYCINQSIQTLTDIKISFKLPSNLRSNMTELEFKQDTVENMTSFYHVIYASYQSPALNMGLSGQISYKDYTNTEKRLFINVVLSTSILLRELELGMDIFQTKWKNRSLYEKKEKINKGSLLMNDFLELLREANISAIQVVGCEVLCATSILSKQEILLHVKLAPLQTELWIKSGSRLLNDSISKMLANLLH